MLSSIGRAAIRRVGGTTNRAGSALHLAWTNSKSAHKASAHAQFALSLQRLYATTTKPAPNATAAKKTTIAKPKAKKVAPKKKPVKKPVKKVKKKVVAKKPVARRAKKVKKTPEQLERAAINKLKATALLSGPPRKPETAWMIVSKEQLIGNSGRVELGNAIKEASAKYKSLTPAEIEQLNHTANENKKANEIAYKAWIESHTPDEVRLANNARLLLKKKGVIKRRVPIHDERMPNRPRSAHIYFSAERWASGDMKGIAIGEASKLIINEYKALSDAERKVYEDKAVADKQRYETEYKTVFHRNTATQQQVAKAKVTA